MNPPRAFGNRASPELALVSVCGELYPRAVGVVEIEVIDRRSHHSPPLNVRPWRRTRDQQRGRYPNAEDMNQNPVDERRRSEPLRADGRQRDDDEIHEEVHMRVPRRIACEGDKRPVAMRAASYSPLPVGCACALVPSGPALTAPLASRPICRKQC